MIKELKHRYDYKEYVALCHRDNKPVRPKGQYLNGISVLEYGLHEYGDKDWQESYIKAFEDINKPDLPEADCCANEVTEEEVKPLGAMGTIKSLAQSTGQHIKHGFKNVSIEETFKRLSACMKCDKLKDYLKSFMKHFQNFLGKN